MPQYIGVPIITDPETLSEDAFALFQTRFPGWSPADANVETILIEAESRIAAEVRDLASRVPTAIFRYFGQLVGILPKDASRAAAQTTWTARDNAGYTIPAGTQVGIRVAGDDLVPFVVTADIAIAPGDTATAAGGVAIVAINAGAASSGIGTPAGPVELITILDFVTGVTLAAATAGGADAESDIAYLNRLRTELQLLTPRPILPPDFAVLAQTVPGVARALAIDLYDPAVNEQQTVTVNATTGTFTLTFSGQTTAAIAYDATASAVRSALEALSNIDPGDVAVTGGPLATAAVTVEFRGQYAGTNVAAMTANSGSLTGGTHTATIATVRGGAAATTGNERMVTVAVRDEAGQPVTTLAKTTVDALLQAERETNFVVWVIDPTYHEIDVTFQFATQPGFDPPSVEATAEAAVTNYLSAANWGLPETEDDAAWVDRPILRYLELAAAINAVPGVDYITTTGGNYDLTVALHGGSLARTDITLTGPAALPTAGTITGTAV